MSEKEPDLEAALSIARKVRPDFDWSIDKRGLIRGFKEPLQVSLIPRHTGIGWKWCAYMFYHTPTHKFACAYDTGQVQYYPLHALTNLFHSLKTASHIIKALPDEDWSVSFEDLL